MELNVKLPEVLDEDNLEKYLKSTDQRLLYGGALVGLYLLGGGARTLAMLGGIYWLLRGQKPAKELPNAS